MEASSQGKTRPKRRVRPARPAPAAVCQGGAGCVETKPKRGGHAFKKRRSFSGS
jgi:hypothetical protein